MDEVIPDTPRLASNLANIVPVVGRDELDEDEEFAEEQARHELAGDIRP